MVRSFWWYNIWTTFVNFFTLGHWRPCVFSRMLELLTTIGEIESFTLHWALGENVGWINPVALGQNLAVISPFQIRLMFFGTKRWGMGDALATFLLTLAATVMMTGISFWTMFSLFHVRTIIFSQLRPGRIGRVTWTMSFVCASAVVGCSWMAYFRSVFVRASMTWRFLH